MAERVERYAVFVGPNWLDENRLRVWVKQLAPTSVVFVTDDPYTPIAVILRQVRCEGLLSVMFRTPGRTSAPRSREMARERRDQLMASMATLVVDFGHQEGGRCRFPDHHMTALYTEEDP